MQGKKSLMFCITFVFSCIMYIGTDVSLNLADLYILCYFICVLGLGHSTSCMLSKHSNPELYFQTKTLITIPN